MQESKVGSRSSWSRCLSSLKGHSCPWCSKSDTVFVGHGTVRFCANCTISWGQSEEANLFQQLKEGQLEEQTFRQKVASMPTNVRKVVNKGVQSINNALGTPSRLTKLRAISNEEWQRAVDASPEPEEI